MSEIEKMLAENVSDISYVNEAALLLIQLTSRVQKVDALMLRMPEHTDSVKEVLKDRRKYELDSLQKIAKVIYQCLDTAGQMVNGRDIADDNIIDMHAQVIKGLKMVINKKA